jgi:hypothetical protein
MKEFNQVDFQKDGQGRKGVGRLPKSNVWKYKAENFPEIIIDVSSSQNQEF